MVNFFFDTADESYVKYAWDKLKIVVNPKYVSGITTNPNAFVKVNMLNLKEWENHLPKLCQVVSDIRNDGEGVVYVQAPNSNMRAYDVLKWAEHISKFNDGQTKLGLKIPPFKPILDVVDELCNIMEINVTGVADCSTALHCFTYDVRYVSIIPGRMEEKGLDTKSHIRYVNQRKDSKADIITGSMRTLEGLRWVSEYGTVPTIGTGVWDLVFGEMGIEEFNSLEKVESNNWSKFSPLITEASTKLSVDFFNQMDDCGKTIHTQFMGDS